MQHVSFFFFFHFSFTRRGAVARRADRSRAYAFIIIIRNAIVIKSPSPVALTRLLQCLPLQSLLNGVCEHWVFHFNQTLLSSPTLIFFFITPIWIIIVHRFNEVARISVLFIIIINPPLQIIHTMSNYLKKPCVRPSWRLPATCRDFDSNLVFGGRYFSSSIQRV